MQLSAVEGGFEVELAAANAEALVSWVLEFGAAAEVVAPEAIRRMLVERVQRA